MKTLHGLALLGLAVSPALLRAQQPLDPYNSYDPRNYQVHVKWVGVDVVMDYPKKNSSGQWVQHHEVLFYSELYNEPRFTKVVAPLLPANKNIVSNM